MHLIGGALDSHVCNEFSTQDWVSTCHGIHNNIHRVGLQHVLKLCGGVVYSLISPQLLHKPSFFLTHLMQEWVGCQDASLLRFVMLSSAGMILRC